MPLVILGIIVVVGASLMIYYQIGPTLSNRVRTPRNTSSSKSNKNEPFGGYIDLAPDLDLLVESDDENDIGNDEGKSYGKSEDGKVLYIFDAGKTEIRPLEEDGEKKEEKEEEREDGE